MRRPTSESWFDEWEKFLILKGVIIHKNTEIGKIICGSYVGGGTNLSFSKDKISGCVISRNGNPSEIVNHDHVILATTPFSIANIVDSSSVTIQNDKNLSLFRNLIKDGPHIQISFTIGYQEIINLPESHIAFIFPDSEYNITLYFQSNIWWNEVFLGPNIKTLISGTACVSYIPGKLYGKKTI